MKKIVIILLLGLILTNVQAQTPESVKYQAIARDLSGNLLPGQNVSYRLSILEGSPSGTVVYSESHLKTTNSFGLADLEIGRGTIISGTFSSIDWGGNTYYLKTEMDPSGGTDYQLMGTSQLLAVPYALYAKKSGNVPWSVNGDDQFNTNSGNVGIGTTTPSAKLDIEGTTSTTNFRMTHGATDGYVLKSDGSGNASWLNPSTLNDTDWIRSGNNLYPDSTFSDHIGIGTSTPGGFLDVWSLDNNGVLDQSQTSSSGPLVDAPNGYFGQSFTVGISGYLSKISINTATAFASGTLYIYKNGIAGYEPIGPLIQTQACPSVPGGNQWADIPIDPLIPVQAGEVYTYLLMAEGWITIYCYKNSSNPYAGGRWLGNDYTDLMFKTYTINSTAPAFVVKLNGNVGIGTTSPVSKLDVTGTTRTTNFQLTTGAANGYLLKSDASGNGSWINPNTLNDFDWTRNGSNLYPLNTSDLVGIGTTNPGKILDVADRIRLRQGSGGSTAGIWLYQTTPAVDKGFIGMMNDSIMGFWGNTSSWSFLMNTNSGRIGIGTSTPKSKLDVEGGAAIGATYSGSSKSPTNGLIVEGIVGIGTTSPNSNAALEISSTTKGFLPPRVTDAQMLAMTPVEGLIVYNTNKKKPVFYNGTAWIYFDNTPYP